MSELAKSLRDAARPALEAEVQNLASEYLAGFEGMLAGANTHVRPAVLGHLAKAADYRWKAINASDEETRRAYVEGAADELASAETVLKSEAVAVSSEEAAAFVAGFERVLTVVGHVAKAALSAVATALIAGAVKGFMGEGGFDAASIFPGA